MEVISNPLDILSFVCANICTNLNANAQKPARRPEIARDMRELVLYCHETLDSFDEEEDQKMTSSTRRRNYQIELGFKLSSATPPQKSINIQINAFKVPQVNVYGDRKRKLSTREQQEQQQQQQRQRQQQDCRNDDGGPPRKMTRNNRGNLYKQIIREEIVH